MRERGYPVDDFDTRAADLSVDHPDVVENYRAGHGIATAHERGKAGTEELRKAVQHYRALFEELLEIEPPQQVDSVTREPSRRV
jgi:pyridoxal biosynthesis lyase PdxS